MARSDLVHAHIAALLREWFNLEQVHRDEDGDYPFRFGTTAYYVRVLDRDPAMVRIFATAVHDAPFSADLLTELNDINGATAFCRATWSAGQVWVEAELWAETADAFSLGMACERVGDLADRIGPTLAALFGGRTVWALDEAEGEEPQPER